MHHLVCHASKACCSFTKRSSDHLHAGYGPALACHPCRLYFDARGETDLRLPLDSSIAVIKLKDSPVASSAAQACSCSTAAPALGGAAHVAGGVPACTGSFDLDAMGTRLLVHAPDACHTFVQKPGHYKVRPVLLQATTDQRSVLLLRWFHSRD